MLRNRLAKRRAADQQEARRALGGEHDPVRRGIGREDPHPPGADRRTSVADSHLALVDVDEGVVGRGQRLSVPRSRRQSHIEEDRRGDRSLDRALDAQGFAGDHRHADALPVGDDRNLPRRDVAIGRRVHLVARGQVQPQLEALHQAVLLFRHLGMDDAARRGHPLDVSGAQLALVARAVPVAYSPGQEVGHGLEAAVRMSGEAADVLAGIIGAERIQHEKRVQPPVQVLRQHTRQPYAGAIRGRLSRDLPLELA